MIHNALVYQDYCAFETCLLNLKCIGCVTMTSNLKSFLTLIYSCFIVNNGWSNTQKTKAVLCYHQKHTLRWRTMRRKFKGESALQQHLCGKKEVGLSAWRWKYSRNPNSILYFSLLCKLSLVSGPFSFFLPKIWLSYFSVHTTRGRWPVHFSTVGITSTPNLGEEKIWLAYCVPVICGQSCRVTCDKHDYVTA